MTSSSMISDAAGTEPARGVVRVFGEARLHTDGDLLALSFGAHGSLWSVEEPGLLRQWGPAGQQLAQHYLSDLETVWAFSPGARLLASASDDLSLWQVCSGRLLHAFAQPSWVTALAFRPDARALATGHDDGIVRLWDAASGQLQREWVHHNRPISALAFHPDGKRLASAAEDRVVCIWELAREEPLATLTGHTDRVHTLAWLPESDHLVTTGWDTTVRIWNTHTLQPILLLNYHAPQVTALTISNDGKLLASADSQDTVHVWDLAEARLRSRLQGPQDEIQCLALSGDGKRLAAGGAGRAIKLWELQSNQFTPPGSAVLPLEQSGFRQGRTCLALSPDGLGLASLEGTTVQLWDTTSDLLRWQADEGALVHSLAYSPKGKWLAGGRDDAAIHLRDAADGRLLGILANRKQQDPVTVLAVSPDAKRLASASATGIAVWIWDVASRQPALLIPDALDGCTIEALGFHPQGGRLAVGGIDWLATGGSDGAISVWDLEERCEIATFPGGVTSLAFHPSGNWLASTSLVKSICLWDMETRQLAAEWLGDDHNALCVAYSPDGRWLVSGGEDHTIRFWDATSGKAGPMAELNTQAQALVFSPDGRFLYTGNSNRSCYQLDVRRLLEG